MQHIEFFQTEFRPVKVKLPLDQMLRIFAATIFILAVMAGYQYWMLGKLGKEFTIIDSMDRKQKEVVAQLTVSVDAMRVQPALEAQASAMRESIANQERLLATLRQQSGTHEVSFASYMQSFMAHHLDGIALSQLSIQRAGAAVSLEGFAADAALLPQYLEGLKQADVLQGIGFSVFELTRRNDDGRVRFQVSSRAHDTEKTP